MPRAGYLWRHCVLNTKNTWLHGDERGFRSRNRAIRSSGDYKQRPPPEEYRKLREYFERVTGDEVRIARKLRAIVGIAMLMTLREAGYRLLAIAVAKVHAHVIVELPTARARVKEMIGQAKRKSSRAVKDWLPGSIWAAGGEYKIVKDIDHLDNAVRYVLFDQGPDAWTWSFKDSADQGKFGRKRPARRK